MWRFTTEDRCWIDHESKADISVLNVSNKLVNIGSPRHSLSTFPFIRKMVIQRNWTVNVHCA